MTTFLRMTLVVAALMTALGAWIFAVPGAEVGQRYDLPTDAPVLYRALLSVILALFAGVYGWMAAQAAAVRPLLWLGAIGKGGAFLTALALFASGQISAGPVTMLAGDGVLSTIWAVWLLRTRQPVGAPT